MGLEQQTCEACKAGAPKVTDDEIEKLTQDVPGWKIEEGNRQLTRTFKFKNFIDALGFTNKVGSIAEKEQHHPSLITDWGKVTVIWWTHKINGLHRNDFIMAAKINGFL